MLPQIVIWAVVFAVGVPSAWRNPTAAALCISWIFGECVYLVTGNNLPIEFYIWPDAFVLTVMVCKPEYRPCEMYHSNWHQLKCILLERTPADRAVMLIFPLMWVIYVGGFSAYFTWWALWAGVILQILFSSAESLENFWRARARRKSLSSGDDVSRFAGAWGYG